MNILSEVILKNLGSKRKEIVVGPSPGIDATIVGIGDRDAVITMDPVTGATNRLGWLAVQLNANDVATFGVRPSLFFSCILLPEQSRKNDIQNLSKQMGKAAEELGIAIAGGHSEVTPGLKSTIIVGCAIGTTKKGHYVTAAGAKPKDTLIMTKAAGIEGTAILACDRETVVRKELGPRTTKRAKSFFNQTSVVTDAIEAFRTGGVHAMHDPTEGGIAGAVYEMAEASKLGVQISEPSIIIERETQEICKLFGIDPLRLTSSGALLIAADEKSADKIITRLERKSIKAAIIGEFEETRSKRILITKDGGRQQLTPPQTDHLWIALAK